MRNPLVVSETTAVFDRPSLNPFPAGQPLLVGQLRHRGISRPHSHKSERIRILEVYLLVFQRDFLICILSIDYSYHETAVKRRQNRQYQPTN